MKHIVLVGDSIFDNASYVSAGESVTDQLTQLMDGESRITLLAVDGDITTDVPKQLEGFPVDATHVFVSCGGNDALRVANVLNESASSVGGALDILVKVRNEFRANSCGQKTHPY